MGSRRKVSAEQFETFLSAPPPRTIPRAISRRVGSHLAVQFVGGLLFLAIGSPFLYLFFPWNLFSDLRLRLSATGTTATVTQIESTSMYENEEPVFVVHFSFPGPSGTELGANYRTGAGPSAGDSVFVEYLESDPSTARLEGHRLNPFGYLAAFVAIFPLIGLILYVSASTSYRRRYRMLKYGMRAEGTVKSCKAGYHINNVPTVKLIVSFSTPEGKREAPYRAWGVKAAPGERVNVLYDPKRPERVVVVDPSLE